MPAPVWVRQKAAIEQHDGDLRPFESENDALIGFVAISTPFKRRKENSGDFLSNILLAEFPGLVRFGGRIRRQVTPKQSMLGRLRRLRHTLADRTKDLRVGDVGKQQTEQQTAIIGRAGSDIATRACPPLNQTGQLQFSQRSPHGNSGSFKSLQKSGFTGEFLAGLISSRDNIRFYRLENLTIFWSADPHICIRNIKT